MQLDRFTIKSQEALQAAIRLAADRRNTETATEHLLLALRGHVDGLPPHDDIATAIEQVRGPHRVTDQSPEDKYQALQRFGRDLTQAADEGKLDPVIGRDDEIRRVIQVLSRRTKNNPVLI